MPNYDNSIPLDTNVSAYPSGFDDAVRFISEEMQNRRCIERWHQRYTDHLRLILINLYRNFKIDTLLYTAYSRNRNSYKNQRYHSINFRYDSNIVIIDSLFHLGYVEGVKGYHFKEQRKFRNSRVRATESLIATLENRFCVSTLYICRAEMEETIVLKDETKTIIDYEDNKDTERMRANLTTINTLIGSVFVGLRLPDNVLHKMNEELRAERDEEDKEYRPIVDFSKVKLRRVFNNSSFKQGGRFYNGWWQSIPSRYRPYIRIDDVSTVEVDFSGLHINLLYAEEGLPIPTDDVYTLEGVPKEARKVLKLALQIILNSKDERKALWRIRQDFKKTDYPEVFGTFTHKHLIDEFKKKHEAISKYFYTGHGVKLQYIDSEIAEAVMLSLGERGIVALPIHDSFIVPEDCQEQLTETMNAVIHTRYGQAIKCKPDKTAYETDLDFLWDKVDKEDLPKSKEEYEAEWVRECLEYQARHEAWRKRVEARE